MRRALLAFAVVLTAAHCSRGTPRVLIPRSATKLSPNVYMKTIEAGNGPFARCGELYGYDTNTVGFFGVSKSSRDSGMLRRDEFSPDWQTLMLSMRERERVRAWIKMPNSERFQEYEVHLARVDKLDPTGQGLPELHDSLCGGSAANHQVPRR